MIKKTIITVPNIYHLGKGLYILSFFAFVFSYVNAQIQQLDLSKNFLIGAIFLFDIASLICFFVKKIVSKSIAKQMFIILAFLSVFFFSALLVPWSIRLEKELITIELISLILSLVIWGMIFWGKFHGVIEILRRVKNNLKSNWYIYLLCLLVIILSIETIDDWVKIDCYDYYSKIREIKNWDFTFSTFELFKLCGHHSYGYAIWAYIGECMWPINSYGVKVVQIIMFLLSVMAISGIINSVCGEIPKLQHTFYVTLFIFIPAFLGGIYEITTDFGMMCFYIWAIHFYIKKDDLLFLATMLLLIFTKEPAIILIFGFALGWCFKLLKDYQTNKSKSELLQRRNILIFFGLLSIGSIFLMIFLTGRVWYAEYSPLSIKTTGENFMYQFAFNKSNIITKFKQLFLINFAWIESLLIIILSVLYIKRRKKELEKKEYIFFPLLGSYIMFVFFQLGYVTYCNIRYIFPHYILFTIILCFMLETVIENRAIKLIIAGVLSSLLLIQIFVTLDNVTLKLFKNINIGKDNIITMRTFIINGYDDSGRGILSDEEKYWSLNEMTQTASYNRQYSYFGEAFENFLKKIKYNEKDLLIIAPIYNKNTLLELFGKRDTDAKYYYNADTGNVVLDSEAMPLNFCLGLEDNSINWEDYDRVFYLNFPYRTETDVLTVLNRYEIKNKFKVDYNSWVIDCYHLK